MPPLSPPVSHEELQRSARRHLWMHFTDPAAFADRDIPVMTRGSGVRLWDSGGRRFLDGLSGLYTVQIGHGRTEPGEAGARQSAELAYYPVWGGGHPRAIELAERLAALAPGDLNRVFFTTGGSEAVESAWKLARQYHRALGAPGRYKAISREGAYHGTSLGALAITGLPAFSEPFAPLPPGGVRVPNTNRYRAAPGLRDDPGAFGLWAADRIEEAILAEGPETVAAVFLEPVQNAGGCLTPPPGYFARVREICDRYGVLLVSDEVICAYGRLGSWFGAGHYGYLPDIVTTAKGLTSGYSPMGAMLVRDRVAEVFEGTTFLHGITFAGHPVSAAVALANLDIIEGEGLLENVRSLSVPLRERLEGLLDLPVVGDVRGEGFFMAVELVKDQATRERFTPEERATLLRGQLVPRLWDLGLLCRVDERVDPCVQLSPPLTTSHAELTEMTDILRTALTELSARL